MATIVTRAGKGSALTHTEMDANFTNLNTELSTAGVSTWIHYNGTSSSIGDSANVSSLGDNGTGRHQINFSTSFGNQNYAATSLSGHTTTSIGLRVTMAEDPGVQRSTSRLAPYVTAGNAGTTLRDVVYNSVMIVD